MIGNIGVAVIASAVGVLGIMDKRTLPRYVSHKEVGALEIKEVSYVGETDSIQLTFADDRFSPIVPDYKLFSRYQPVAGDFYVVYDAGTANEYESLSPRKAFVEGYIARPGQPIDGPASGPLMRYDISEDKMVPVTQEWVNEAHKRMHELAKEREVLKSQLLVRG